MVYDEFLDPLGVSQRDLADTIHVPDQRVNELANGRLAQRAHRVC